MPDHAMSHNPHITGILLAAGRGQRFGGNKCLAPLPDGTPVGLQAAQHLTPAVDRLLCVIRPDDSALRQLFLEHGFETVDCQDADQGMSASLKAGIRASPDHTSGWLIGLADMPFIQPETCQRIASFLKQRQAIVIPEYADRRGHPVGFAHCFRQDLLSLSGDNGARSLISRHHDRVTVFSTTDSGICRDIDTPEDLLFLNNSKGLSS